MRRSIKTNKPVMHTYIDRSDQYVNEEILKVWIEAWRDADWDVKILSPEDAKNHPEYETYEKQLDDANLCCLPRQTFLRHVAMSTVKNGGFYSEPYVFPLHPDIHPEVRENNSTLPNEGKFTSWDGIFGSHMSASHDEWNRMTKVLINNMEKNVVLSLQKIHDKVPNEEFHHEDQVSHPNMLLTNQQFTSDFCKEYENYSTIRFHPSEMQQNSVDADYSHDIISSWFKLHKARCWGDRPVIFTFYEPVDYLDSENPQDLLEVWETSWSNAGWEPVVLSLGDAKRHPGYKKLIKTLEDSLQFGSNRDRYNYFCFMRWLAMASSGGGWLADYDTFPLKLPASHELPNDGKFTGHANFVPNLMSGSALEWNRMSKELFDTFADHNKIASKSFYSDLYAAKDLLESKQSYLALPRMAQVDDFYLTEIADPATKWRRLDPYDFTKKCHLADDYVAIHFSHYSCQRMWFCREGGHQDREGNHVDRLRRSEIARKWLEAWNKQCNA